MIDRPAATPRTLRIGPIARISFGLVALLVSLVLLADLMLGVVPGRNEQQQALRQRLTENLAVQIAALVESGDTTALGKTIRNVLARDADVASVTVRRRDGSNLLEHGQPVPRGEPGVAASTTNRLRVPILAGRETWGEIDVRFVPTQPASLRDWLSQPFLQLLVVLGVGGFALCYAYLRRAMQYLNPSASVPDRVRTAFDSLSEGLLILDLKGRIVLANKAFRQLHPAADRDLNGRPLEALDWLRPGGEAAALPAPWATTLASGATIQAQPLALPQPAGEATQLLVSSTAITDHRGRARGCLITFDNVTAVHRANSELRSTLQQLEQSRERIEEQNRELRRLASRDALTGCYNRRAFFEIVEEQFAAARRERQPLCCLMVDIDHFKQFNDRYGHAIGDQVIRAVSRCLSAGLRQGDVLARYGGEEFCIVLPATETVDALAVAERIREDIQASANRAIRGSEISPITASFGLASMNGAARTIELLIDQADQALYQSKKAGRNRVTQFGASDAAAAATDALTPA